jgi:hypothetical protein
MPVIDPDAAMLPIVFASRIVELSVGALLPRKSIPLPVAERERLFEERSSVPRLTMTR